MTESEKILQLRELLHRHNHLYYVANAPTISDFEFDTLMRELQQLEARHPELADVNSPTMRVGSDIAGDFVQVEHARPMLSLSNTYSRDEVAAFYQHTREALGGASFELCCELKFDGLSISLIYENGRLQKAVTRGDGLKGDDVTANVRTIRTLPLCLPHDEDWPQHFEVRGEILMPWDSFNSLNEVRAEQGEPCFANPRNAASGTLKSKNSAVVASRRLDAYCYAYYADESVLTLTHYERLQRIKDWQFKVSDAISVARSLDDVLEFIDYWDTARHDLPFATDGVVLKVNDPQQQTQLGTTAKSPRWAIAYKFQPERRLTRLQEVSFQVGRTGAITPVAHMDPVQLSGTMVRRATLHNADYIQALDLHIGDMIEVEKAGEIIPQVLRVATDQRDEHLGPRVVTPVLCPACGAPLVRYDGEAVTYCTNALACPPQAMERLAHYVSRDAMNIATVGQETIREWYEKGMVCTPADLYELDVAHLCGEDGTRIRSAKKMVAAIEQSKQASFDRVLYAIGIRFVGRVVAKQLAVHFPTIECLMEATADDLLQVEGVGERIAQSVMSFFAQPENRLQIERLRNSGVAMAMEKLKEPTYNDLVGHSIVVSGTFVHHSREEYKALIALHGGKCVSSISQKTSFILAGDNMGPAKLEKARSLSIPIVDEETFLSTIAAATEEATVSHQLTETSLKPTETAVQLSLFDEV